MRCIGALLAALACLVAAGCRALEEGARSGGRAALNTQSVPVPEGCTSVLLVPDRFDIGVFEQDHFALWAFQGTGVARHPGGPFVVAHQPLEFHVGNRFFFEEGLGLQGDLLEGELAAVRGPEGVPPLVLTSCCNMLEEADARVPVPTGFDGAIVFLKPTGRKSDMCDHVKAVVQRVVNRDMARRGE
jgi:hypothetical protein